MILIWVIAVCLLWGGHAPASSGKTPDLFSGMNQMLGDRDAVLVSDPEGRILFAHHPGMRLVPASTIKLLTALTAFHYLGSDFRFPTQFYLGSDSSLKIKGYGDPLLISEIVEGISQDLAREFKGNGRNLNHIIIDNTFFHSPISIPGVSGSSEPYDAPNGAFCVNFNTVNFKMADGAYVSAESQTPLLPVVLPGIRDSGLKNGRITLSHRQDEITYYAGYLFNFFLEKAGVGIEGTLKIESLMPQDRLVLEYRSRYTLEQAVGKMLRFSNNFMANQIFIFAGASHYGGPGTLEKGVQATMAYAHNQLGLDSVTIAEGSGISRVNRVSANEMMTVLSAFEPYHALMKKNGRHYFKTGHLKGIRTQVGYYGNRESGLFRYVILLNTPGKSVHPVVEGILQGFKNAD